MQPTEIFGLVRTLLAFGGGIVVSKGLIDEATMQQLTGGLLALGAGAWSIAEKRKTRAR